MEREPTTLAAAQLTRLSPGSPRRLAPYLLKSAAEPLLIKSLDLSWILSISVISQENFLTHSWLLQETTKTIFSTTLQASAPKLTVPSTTAFQSSAHLTTAQSTIAESPQFSHFNRSWINHQFHNLLNSLRITSSQFSAKEIQQLFCSQTTEKLPTIKFSPKPQASWTVKSFSSCQELNKVSNRDLLSSLVLMQLHPQLFVCSLQVRKCASSSIQDSFLLWAFSASKNLLITSRLVFLDHISRVSQNPPTMVHSP